MALIYRSIFEVEDPAGTFMDRFPDHIRDWLRYKLRAPDLTFSLDDTSALEGQAIEVTAKSGENDVCSVTRIEAYEGSRDDGVELKTTITALREEDRSWAWIDLERWTQDHAAAGWVPAPPGIVTTLLLRESAMRGSLELGRVPATVSGKEGELVARLVLDNDRELPLVVVSYNERETGGVGIAQERGDALAKRLAGVASVYVLGEGAVTSFSKAMHQAIGDGMDVHSGAVRTYLPGVGSEPDYPARHRFIGFRKIENRRADVAALIVAPPLFRRAAESPPPPIWRSSARALLVGHAPDNDYEALLAVADEENAELRFTTAQLRDGLAAERADNDELQRRNDDLSRRLKFFRQQAQAQSTVSPTAEPEPDSFQPVLCTEVIEHARAALAMLEIPLSVDVGAEALDAHGDESWAGRAWVAFRALDNYAQLKIGGSFDGGFLTYCERSEGEFVVPSSWVVPTESAQTLSNRRFRELRTLPVSPDVDPSREVLMQEHIRIERGGTPSPRIHYHDDTRGRTGKVHIGWFGDHLDSRAKS